MEDTSDTVTGTLGGVEPVGDPDGTTAAAVESTRSAAVDVLPSIDGDASKVAPVADVRQRAPKGSGKPSKKKRYGTDQEKEERNQRDRLARAALKAAREAETGKASAHAQAAANRKTAAASEPEAPAQQGIDLAVMIGLTAHGVSMVMPPGFGGGALTEEERTMLGKCWAVVLAPKLQGESAPLTIALVQTFQVFGLRALAYRLAHPKNDERTDAPHGIESVGPVGEGDASATTRSEIKSSAPAAKAAGRMPVSNREHGARK